MKLARIPPFTVTEWDETGGYDCITPAVNIRDVRGALVCTIDAKDFGWNACGLGTELAVYREAVHQAVVETAQAIVDAVNARHQALQAGR